VDGTDSVTPAQAGVQDATVGSWIPACAGMTAMRYAGDRGAVFSPIRDGNAFSDRLARESGHTRREPGIPSVVIDGAPEFQYELHWRTRCFPRRPPEQVWLSDIGYIMSESPAILKAENAHKSYRMGATRVVVLKGVDLVVREGEFVAIVGASGSGKSTLLHLLGGLDKPDKGVIQFQGRDVNRMGSRELNQYRNETVGFVFQFYHLLDELSVLENVILPAMVSRSVLGWLVTRHRARKRGEELLDQLGLRDRARHKPYQLSGGERQRTAIGRALMNQPKLLLADEPTGNLDSTTGNGILNVFETLNKAGQTIVLVTHDERVARRAQRIITLVDGRVRA